MSVFIHFLLKIILKHIFWGDRKMSQMVWFLKELFFFNFIEV